VSDRPEPIDVRLERAGLPPLRRTAWIEIDTAALTSNLKVLRRLAGIGVAVMPVVKADAYGHGMIEITRILAGAGADGVCVASLDEAVALRDAGVAIAILVMYPIPPDDVREAIERGIGIAGGAAPMLDATLAAAAPALAGIGGAGAGGSAPELVIELEVETGLGRGGVAPADIVGAVARIQAAGARLGGVWSHLQEAEVASITTDQIRLFEEALAALASAGMAVPRRHLAASGALLLGTVPAYEAVRPGLATYGLIPDELAAAGIGLADLRPEASELCPVLSLHARPVRVAELPEGHGVSYGPTWRAARRSRIATLPLGYGDGWSRALSNRAEVLVRSRRVPLVGNVAMDAVMADVTDVPGSPVTVDDEFVLIGRQGPAEIGAAEVARWRNTNSWEVVTTLSARLTRVYDAPAGVTGLCALAPQETPWLGSNSGTATSASSRSRRS
jgi:alanine racemase